jgi:hypothetical protein
MKIFADNADGTKGDIVYKMLDGEWVGNSYTCDQSEVLFSGDEEEVEEEGDAKDEEKDEDEGKDEKETEEDGKKEDEGDEKEEGEQKSRRAGGPRPMEEDVPITYLPLTSSASSRPAFQQPLPQTPAPASPLFVSPEHTDTDDMMEEPDPPSPVAAKCSLPTNSNLLETPVPPDLPAAVSPEYAVPPSSFMYAETVTNNPPPLSITPTTRRLSPTCGAPSESVFETY